MTDFVDTKPTGLYEAAIGEKNQDYYVTKFEDFDHRGTGLMASWNWAAFFLTGFWALYRKMYGWFFAWWAVGTVLTVYSKVQNSQIHQILGIVVGVLWVAFSLYANSLYHRKVKSRIAAAQKSNSDASRVSRRLSTSGGVHTWVPIVFGGIPVIGIVAAVALPAYQDYAKPKASAEPKPWEQQYQGQSQTNAKRSQIDEFLSEAPTNQPTELPTQQNAARMPIKYGKDDTPLDGQPASQQNAARANPYGQFDPSTARPVDAETRSGTNQVAVAQKSQSVDEQEHLRRIYSAHSDADAINDSRGFKAWVAKYPAYQRILKQGSTQEIIEMFTAYKNQR